MAPWRFSNGEKTPGMLPKENARSACKVRVSPEIKTGTSMLITMQYKQAFV